MTNKLEQEQEQEEGIDASTSGAAKIQLRRFMQLNNHSSILVDGEGHFYQHFDIPKDFKPKQTRLRYGCGELCGFPNLKRVHLTCLHCRPRRVYEGKLEPLIPITLHLFTISRSPTRKYAKVKDLLIKQLKSIIEYLSD